MGRSLVVDDWIGLLALFIHRSALSARMAFVLQQIQTPIQCKNMLFKQPLRLIDLFARFLMNIVITQLAANPAHPESCQELQVVERQLRGTVKPRHFQISTAYCYIYIYIPVIARFFILCQNPLKLWIMKDLIKVYILMCHNHALILITQAKN